MFVFGSYELFHSVALLSSSFVTLAIWILWVVNLDRLSPEEDNYFEAFAISLHIVDSEFDEETVT